MKPAFAKTPTSQVLTVHQHQRGMTVKKNKEALQSSCISDLFYKRSAQAVTCTGLSPLKLTESGCLLKGHCFFCSESGVRNLAKICLCHTWKCPCGHADYRTTSKHLLFLLLKTHNHVHTGVFTCGHCLLALYGALSFTYTHKKSKSKHVRHKQSPKHYLFTYLYSSRIITSSGQWAKVGGGA